MVGKNTEQWLSVKTAVYRHGFKFGTTKEELFVCYEVLKKKYGKEVDKMPLARSVSINFSEKIRVGLQQLMAGARK